ncbi:MAG: hypothetical protein ACK5IJ_11585, partial [Mangrovibacterium sp.]
MAYEVSVVNADDESIVYGESVPILLTLNKTAVVVPVVNLSVNGNFYWTSTITATATTSLAAREATIMAIPAAALEVAGGFTKLIVEGVISEDYAKYLITTATQEGITPEYIILDAEGNDITTNTTYVQK